MIETPLQLIITVLGWIVGMIIIMAIACKVQGKGKKK